MNDTGESKYPIFRMWEAPSFEPTVSWTILVDRFVPRLQKPMLRRVIGSKLTSFTSRDVFQDIRNDISQKGTIVDDYNLKPHEFDTLRLFQPFSFQIMSNIDPTGCDGSIYGMQLCSPLPVFIVEWWEGGPDGWHEMIEWATQTRLYLSNLIDRFELDIKDINQAFSPDYKIWRYVDGK